MNEEQNRLPLGLFKQAVMKLDSFLSDIAEIKEDEDINDIEKQNLNTISEMGQTMLAHLINMVSSEIDEEEFLNENIEMDEIDAFPETEIETKDIIDEEIQEEIQ